MTILSAQSIRRLKPIDPILPRTLHEETGMTFGLGPCSYDVRIRQGLDMRPGECALASTVETFNMPDDVCASVMDKSTLARKFLSLHNTHVDPGFRGGLTLELFNESSQPIHLIEGQPIAQVRFEWLDAPTEQPYSGKYQDQNVDPVGPVYETGGRDLVGGTFRHYKTPDSRYLVHRVVTVKSDYPQGVESEYGYTTDPISAGETCVSYMPVPHPDRDDSLAKKCYLRPLRIWSADVDNEGTKRFTRI